MLDVGDGSLLKVLVRQSGDAGHLAGDRGVEGQTNAVDRLGNRLGCIAPSQSQRGQAIELGEGVGHHDVLGGSGEIQAIIEATIEGELTVGPVQHQDHAGRQGGVQPLDFGK